MSGTGLEFNRDDLVTIRDGSKVQFIGMVIDKSDILSDRNLSFLKRYHDSKAVYTVKGWNADGEEGTQTFFDDQLEPAFKLDFDRLILLLTKKKIMLDSTINRLETLQDRALEARRKCQ